MSRKLRVLLPLAGLALCLWACDLAQAQDRRQGGGRFGGGSRFGERQQDPVSLLRNDAVRKELEIEGGQQEELSTISREMREELEKEIAELRQRIQAKYRTKIDDVLLPHQSKRLDEISVQLRGLDALRDPDIVEKLGLSDSQQKQIAQSREDFSQKLRAALRPQDGERPNFEGLREKMEQMRKDRDESVLSVLTTKQRNQFDDLKGEAIDRSQFSRGGFGQGRFGGQGGDRGQRGQGGRRPGQGGRGGGDRPRRPGGDT